MKNWRTTAAGILVALVTLEIQVKNGALLLDWQSWILPVSIALFGFLSKDASPETDNKK